MSAHIPTYSVDTHFFPVAPAFAHELIHFDSGCQSSHFESARQSSPSLTSPEVAAIRELSHLPLSARHNQSIELFGTPVSCRCLIAGVTLKYVLQFTILVDPPHLPLSNPHSILQMSIYMPHTTESKQAHLKVHMLMCDI